VSPAIATLLLVVIVVVVAVPVTDASLSVLDGLGAPSTVGITDVSAFTVAVSYRVTGTTGSETQQLVEHHSGTEWYLETENHRTSPYVLEYAVDHAGGERVRTGLLDNGETHVAVGTYDGATYELYRDGSRVATDAYDQPVQMGDLVVGADAPSGGLQHLEGRIYQIRLYYRALDGDDVATLSRAMEAEAE
jgi:hypothetical protein